MFTSSSGFVSKGAMLVSSSAKEVASSSWSARSLSSQESYGWRGKVPEAPGPAELLEM